MCSPESQLQLERTIHTSSQRKKEPKVTGATSQIYWNIHTLSQCLIYQYANWFVVNGLTVLTIQVPSVSELFSWSWLLEQPSVTT